MLIKVGPVARSTDESGDEIRQWRYEAIEVYKGEPKTKYFWSRGNTSSCGAYLKGGPYYLVAPGDDGGIGLCGITRIGDPSNNEKIRILNAHKYGEIPELTEPWYFAEAAGVCGLEHQFASGQGHLSFRYRYGKPEWVNGEKPDTGAESGSRESERNRAREERVRPSLEPGFLELALYLGGTRYIEEGSGRLIIGDRQWETRRAFPDRPPAWPYAQLVDATAAQEVLAALAEASSVSVAWKMRDFPYGRDAYPDYPDATARTSVMYLTAGISEFRRCLERGVSQDD